MSVQSSSFTVETRGRGTIEITNRIREAVKASAVVDGLCTVFIHHTSASLLITENVEQDVQRDLGAFLARLVPDGDALFAHTMEGPDDMAAHIRAALTQTSISIPIEDGRCAFGTWQGVFLWEHRHRGQRRRVTVTVVS